MESEIELPSDKEQAFIDSYVIHLQKSRAAVDAGYSEDTARQKGYEVYNRPHVKAAIEKKLQERTITADETVKLVSDISQTDLSDYFKAVQKLYTPQEKRGLQFLIDQLQFNIEIETEYLGLLDASDAKEKDATKDRIKSMERDIMRFEIELNKNPTASRIVDGESQLITEMQLDIDAVIADKERGRIKKYKLTKDGALEIEMYSALDAAEKLLKVHGKYEKDNAQSRPIIPKIMRVEIVPPLEVDE